LKWARSVEPATFEETVNAGLETRRAKWERSLAEDRATAERFARALRLLEGWEREAAKYGPPAYVLPNRVWMGNDEDGILGRLEAALEGRI
jgi:hypothetical protein